MKKITVMLAALLVANVGSPVLAKNRCTKHQRVDLQQQKETLKVWKQRKAAIQPLQLKDLIDENHSLKIKNQEFTEEIKSARSKLEQLVKLPTQVEGLKNCKWDAETGSEAGTHDDHLFQEMIGFDGLGRDDWAVDKNNQCYIKGIVFKVQMGAYKKRDLSNILEDNKSRGAFEQERSGDVNEYTLRHFRDYWKANQFKKELRAMGLKDAWIVAFKDGRRVPLRDVLQEVIEKK
jgi:hypothetical protein